MADTASRIIVGVPKAAVDENRHARRPENQIRFSWQILSVKPVTMPKATHKLAHSEFGLHALAFDTPHVFGAALRR